jgi:hypothetical protein
MQLDLAAHRPVRTVAPGSLLGLNRTTDLILLSFLVLALMIVGFYRVLTGLLSAGV